MPELGALSIGAVAAFIAADRIACSRGLPGAPVATWLAVLAAGVSLETWACAGLAALAWLVAGAAAGGLTRTALANASQALR